MGYRGAAQATIEALATTDAESMRYMLNRIVAVADEPEEARKEIEAVWLEYGGQPGVWEVPEFQDD